jgi:hypothetical protein
LSFDRSLPRNHFQYEYNLMQVHVTEVSNQDPAKGLPAVVPPTGRFIVQLFLVPFLIVSAVVSFLLVVDWFVTGTRNPQEFLTKLDSANPDVRWRGAENLAQVLLRDDQLSSNPPFALDLAERLQNGLSTLQNRTPGPSSPPSNSRHVGSSLDDDYLQDRSLCYLSACLGNIMVGVGAPVLDQIALESDGDKPAATLLRRRQALWALAKLGENLKRFEKLPKEPQAKILAILEEESSQTNERGSWARAALNYITGPASGSLAALGVDKVFDRCSQDPDPFMRELVAYALNFWSGTEVEARHIDSLLDKLSFDDGHGEDRAAGHLMDNDNENPSDSITKFPGSRIRFNATVALARRGSNKVRLGMLGQMLDERGLGDNFKVKLEDGQEVADEGLVATTVITALRALTTFHAKQPNQNLSELEPALLKLRQSRNMVLSGEAGNFMSQLGWK